MRAGLDRIASQVQQHPVDLVAVGLEGELGRRVEFDRRSVVGQRQAGLDLVEQRPQLEPARREWRRALARKIEGLAAQRDGAVDRIDEARRHPTHLGRGAGGEAVGHEARRC